MTVLDWAPAVFALIVFVLAFVVDRTAVRQLREVLQVEQARTTDLLNRLASRTPAEYHALTGPLIEAPLPPEYLYDSTGLIAVDDDGE